MTSTSTCTAPSFVAKSSELGHLAQNTDSRYLLERLPEGDEDEDDDEILSRLPFAKPPADDGAAGDDAGDDDEDGH